MFSFVRNFYKHFESMRLPLGAGEKKTHHSESIQGSHDKGTKDAHERRLPKFSSASEILLKFSIGRL